MDRFADTAEIICTLFERIGEIKLYSTRKELKDLLEIKGNTIKMNNIIFEKVWQDNNLIELKISASCEFASAYQSCYIEDKKLEEIAEEICAFARNFNKSCYLEFGEKRGNYTPAFSMCMLPADMSGHVKIEVDIEIADNDTRSHRCCFYVKSELGLIERLGKRLKGLILEQVGNEVSLL